MTFGFPAFFWAMLALLPLAAVYFIKTRPRRQPVNAFFLWQQVFKLKATNSLFQRLRNLLSLLLVALAFLAAVFALTRPSIGDGAAPDLLIVVDRSASMNGVDDGKSRLVLAKELAGSWITALDGSQRAAIATVASHIDYRANLTHHTKQLRDALDGIEASDLSLDPHALDELSLLSTTNDAKKTRILFLTDRHSAPMTLPAGVEVVTVGGQSGNAGITAADLHWEAPDRATLFVSLISNFPAAREVELELVSAETGKLAHLFSMNLPARGEASESIPLQGIEPGAWLLRLRGSDALATDDIAPLGLNAPQPIPVQVTAKNPFFFQQCIAAFSRADLLFEPTDHSARLSLAEGPPPETETTIVFSPAGESPFWKDIGAELSPGAPEIVSKDHALIARIDPALLAFDGAKKLTAPAGSVVVLAHADGTPLLYTCSANGRRAVVLNFDPSREDFFLSPWFPVLVHDAAVLLTGRENSFPSTAATGSTIEIPGTEAVTAATLRQGEKVSPLPLETPVIIERVGNYGFSRNSANWQLGGAVFSSGESGPATAGTPPPEIKLASGWPLAAWLLLAALIALFAEEILYHRRKVG
jgi:Aerotolerance regulator N-terminal/von Willebrand factor type A domain